MKLVYNFTYFYQTEKEKVKKISIVSCQANVGNTRANSRQTGRVESS